MTAKYRRALHLLCCLLLPLCAFADDVPTVDLQKGNSYREFQKTGLKLCAGEQFRPGARSSDTILETTLRVVVAPGKSFVLDGDRLGVVGVSADESTIDFFSLAGAYPTPAAAKEKLREIGQALGFDAEGAEAVLATKSPCWVALGDATAPCWVVELTRPGLPWGILRDQDLLCVGQRGSRESCRQLVSARQSDEEHPPMNHTLQQAKTGNPMTLREAGRSVKGGNPLLGS